MCTLNMSLTNVLCLFALVLSTAERKLGMEEPQCLSRFDYEFKLVQKLAQMELEQQELRKMVQDLQLQITGTSKYTMALTAHLHKDTVDLTAGTTVIFDDAILNLGNSYDPHHGVFTATVGGVYLFTMTLASQTSAQLWLMKNGEPCEYTFAQGAHWSTGSASATLTLEPTDRVWVEGRGIVRGYSGYEKDNHHRTYHSSLTGFLITTL